MERPRHPLLAHDASALSWLYEIGLPSGIVHLSALSAHTWRVCVLAVQIAVAADVSHRVRRDVRGGALLHDIGKYAVPQHILQKPGPLTAPEWVVLRQHPAIGADVLARLRTPAGVVAAVRHHHERWDGGGYPDGLRGTAIPLAARIITLADAYDAMTHDRPYRAAMPGQAARAIVAAERGAMFDPSLADILLSVLGRAEA